MVKLGILGGGQLAQMTAQAAISLGVDIVIFERKPDSPASRLTHFNVVGEWDDREALNTFIEMCDVITLENEFVDASVLKQIEEANVPMYPSSATLAKVQDKLIQKRTMREARIPVPDFVGVASPDDVLKAGEKFGYPMVMKARRDGYDGYGNYTINAVDEIATAWTQLGGDDGRELLVEKFVPFERELAVMVLRGRDGEIRTYPVVETIQKDHICHVVRAPAPVPSDSVEITKQIATRAVTAIDGVGVFGVELFKLMDGTIMYNEIAPRPHNSGHYTIEACVTSQFENHIHAILGWALGATSLVTQSAVMVNLLGERRGETDMTGIRHALRVSGAHVHIYGKRDVRPGRKMGHITVTGESLETLEQRAHEAAELVTL